MTIIYQRCANGAGCAEVVDRLVAADRSDADGFHEVAAQLRETAQRFAELHRHGSGLGSGHCAEAE